MIPLTNFLVPLLHTLIGIGNDLYDNFRDFVNREIECLDPKEMAIREKLITCEAKIASDVAERDNWDRSSTGKKAKSLKGMIYRRNKALKEMGMIVSPSSNTKDTRSGFERLINDLDEYVDGDDSDADDDSDGEEEEEVSNANNLAISNNNNNNNLPMTNVAPNQVIVIMNQNMAKLKQDIRACNTELNPLLKERKSIEDKIAKGRKILVRLKDELTEFRSSRKKSEDGMESKLLGVLRSIGVELTRYHGGSLAGMDIKKVISNASYVFDEFAKILVEYKRPDCKVKDEVIKRICAEHKLSLLLWDGAFSAARSINPTQEDCIRYLRFVQPAVDCHVRIGCSLTHKVHLMLCHVLTQMRTIPRGLGEKMEDWVELMHQIGNRARICFRTTKDIHVRAIARARDEECRNNPLVAGRISEVHESLRRNWKLPIGDMEDEQREAWEKARDDALTDHGILRTETSCVSD